MSLVELADGRMVDPDYYDASGGGRGMSRAAWPIRWTDAGRSARAPATRPATESRTPPPFDVSGTAVVMGRELHWGRRRELYEPWSFAGQDGATVPLMLEHRRPIGVARLQVLPAAVLATGILHPGLDLELPDPLFMSIGVRQHQERAAGELIRIGRATIAEVSLVPKAAYFPYTRAKLWDQTAAA